jgi:hypothetical protein
MSKSGVCSSILWNFNLLKLAAIIQNFIFTFNLTSLDHVPFFLLFLLGLSFWTSHENMWELYFPSLFSFIFPFLQRVSHERMQEGFTKQERKNEGHKPSSCFVAFCLDIGLSLFWLCNAIVRSWTCGRFSEWVPKLICQSAPKKWIQMKRFDLAKQLSLSRYKNVKGLSLFEIVFSLMFMGGDT